MTATPSVLLIASDTIGERMAGSGIRYWNMARVVGQQQPVTLATPSTVSLSAPHGVTLVAYGGPGTSEDERGNRLAALVAEHDVVVAQHLPYLHADPDALASRHIVVDLYAPWVLEKLEYARLDPERGEPNRRDDLTILERLLGLGDYFLCASERQRDYWLGALTVAGRLEPAYLQADPALRSLIDVVAFGLPADKPRKTGPGPRSVFPGIGDDDPLLIWNGGVWNWLDPLTAIRAVAALTGTLPELRLVFMGVRSPGAQVAKMGIVDDAIALASELGVLNRNVFFNDWAPHDERQNWLLEADAALSLHVKTVEARYAYRTRVMDILWCGLPAVVSDGDVLADLVRDEDIGELARPGDVASVAAAIERVLEPDRGHAIRSRLADVAARFTWEQVCAPLLRYCRKPWKLSPSRGGDPSAEYLARLERMYSETAQYARHLEAAVAERDMELAARRKRRTRPDLNSLFNRTKRG
ncbi:MAG TPA: glycosyltransferase family 4 protein [Thermomicrobiales bacterium]|nr:glycosyltransferase family 4 protein [Thermomicrobiales bacterium]